MSVVPWICTILHAVLTIVMVLGVVFSKTVFAQFTILSALLVILFLIRYNDGCFVTKWEKFASKPTLTDMGRAYSLKEDTKISERHYEEIVVSNLLLIHLIKMIGHSILPLDILF